MWNHFCGNNFTFAWSCQLLNSLKAIISQVQLPVLIDCCLQYFLDTFCALHPLPVVKPSTMLINNKVAVLLWYFYQQLPSFQIRQNFLTKINKLKIMRTKASKEEGWAKCNIWHMGRPRSAVLWQHLEHEPESELPMSLNLVTSPHAAHRPSHQPQTTFQCGRRWVGESCVEEKSGGFLGNVYVNLQPYII